MERKIIIGLITSTEYCSKIKDVWETRFMESATARLLSTWCWEYYDKYKKAPGKDIEGIYITKLKTGKISKAVAEEIEQEILPGLSSEYEEQDKNVQYLLEESESYFNERQIAILSETVDLLLKKGEITEAQKLIREFKPLEAHTEKLDPFILSVKEIRKRKKPHPALLMGPWLRSGQTTILYGKEGSGKSLLALLIAYVLGVKNYEDKCCEIGKWQVKKPTGCLYIDGEIGQTELEERITQYEWIGLQPPDYKIRVLSVPEYQEETEDTFPLSNRENQRKIITWLKEHPTYKFIILDSITTLFNLEDENNNSEWNTKISPFIRDLRAIGVACLLLHHAGKDGKRGLRGASSMAAMAHNVFRITTADGYAIEEGRACFRLTIEKQRAGGKSFAPFIMKFNQTDTKDRTIWEIEAPNTKNE